MTFRVANHPLIQTLRSLEGNPKACVYTEPLFGIPFNLYTPYASIYMVGLGLVDQQIGLIASINLAIQIFTALLGGAITDKLGRRLTTFVFDLIAWSIPVLILIFAQNFWYFLAAAIFNSAWRVTHTSWTCLLVEDARADQLVHIWVWVYIAGLVAAFFTPLAGLMVGRYTLVPAVRGLYIFAFFMLTAKFFILYFFSTETGRGKERIAETRHQSIFSLLAEYRGVVGIILRTPATLLTLGIMIIMGIYTTVNGTFWAILVTQKLHIPAENIALFSFIRSMVILGMFFVVTPRITTQRIRLPLLVGFSGYILSQFILISMPAQSYVLLSLTVIVEACSMALVNPLVDSLLVVNVDPKERARITSILFVVIFIFISPFGWIAGRLSSIDKTLPFVLNLVLFGIALVLSWLAARRPQMNAESNK